MSRSSRTDRRRSKAFGCAMAGLLGPSILILSLWVAWNKNNRPPRLTIPTHTMPSVNGRDDFQRACLLAKNLKHKSPYSLPLPPAQAITDANFAACAAEGGPVLAAIRLGLTKECIAPPVRSYQGIRFYSDYREVARTLEGIAGHLRRVGRNGEAALVYLDGVEFGIAATKGENLSGYLGADSIVSMCLPPVEGLIPKLTGPELAAVAQRLDKVIARSFPFREVVLEDGYFEAAAMTETLRDPAANRISLDYFDRYQFLTEVPDGQPLTLKARAEIVRYGFSNKGAMVRDNLAYKEALAKELVATPFALTYKTSRPDNVWSNLAGDTLLTVNRLHVTRMVELEVIRTMVALSRYRLDNGTYPGSLRELCPVYLANVQADLFSGIPGTLPIYRPTADRKSYTLYSVGPDMKDNGGIPMANINAGGPGDIVAGKLFPRRKKP